MISSETVLYGMATRPGLPPSRRTTDKLSGFSDGRKRQIVIAEDDYFVGLNVEQALLNAGYEVLALVSTGEEAVRECIRLRPDLVLMDIRLAGEISGIEAAVALRAEGITSLFATAHSDDGTRAEGEKAQPAGWLTKPFSDDEIVSAVAAALSGGTGEEEM